MPLVNLPALAALAQIDLSDVSQGPGLPGYFLAFTVTLGSIVLLAFALMAIIAVLGYWTAPDPTVFQRQAEGHLGSHEKAIYTQAERLSDYQRSTETRLDRIDRALAFLAEQCGDTLSGVMTAAEALAEDAKAAAELFREFEALRPANRETSPGKAV